MLGLDFGDRWDDPVNRWLCRWPHAAFCFSAEGELRERLHTNVVAITGPGTAFDDERECRLADMDDDTILVIEVASTDIHWAEPGDLPIDEVSESITSGFDGDGVHVLFADGSVWYVHKDVPFDDLRKFFTIQGAREHDREQLLAPYASQK